MLLADRPGAFAERVVELLTDPELAARIAVAGRRHATRHFNWNEIGDHFRAVLEATIGLTARDEAAGGKGEARSAAADIRTDCRHYRNNVPCAPHKRSLESCDRCGELQAIQERIVIVKLDAMGDVLRTTSCLAPLKQRYPRSHITWITRQNAVPLLAGNPWIDRILPIESNYLEYVTSEDFDLAIGPDADLCSASIMSLVRAATKRGFLSDRRGGVVPLNDAAEAWWHLGLNDVAKRQNRRTYGEWLSRSASCRDRSRGRTCARRLPPKWTSLDDCAPALRRLHGGFVSTPARGHGGGRRGGDRSISGTSRA